MPGRFLTGSNPSRTVMSLAVYVGDAIDIMCALRGFRAVVVTLIVAAFGAQSSAASDVSEDVPVPAGTAAIARELGLATVPDRARFVAEITRLVYDSLDRKNEPLQDLRQRLRRMTIEG